MRVRYFRYFLTIAIFIVYWQVRNFEFVTWDDNVNIYENQLVINPSFENILFFWTNFYEFLYIPVTYTIWSGLAFLSNQFLGSNAATTLNPMPFHLANLFLHTVNTLLVFGILRLLLKDRLRQTQQPTIDSSSKVEYASFIGALFFALHPMQVESVAWATEMKGLLCATFSFLSIRFYIRYVVDENSKQAVRSGYYFASFATFVLALLSKPIAVSLPLLICVIDIFVLGRPVRTVLRSTMLWFILAAVFVLVTTSAQPGELTNFTSPLWARPFIAGDALSFYLGKVLLPANLTIDYGRSVDATIARGQFYFTAIIPLLLLLFISRLKDRSIWFASYGILIAALLPVLGLVPFLFQFFSTVADRYAYIAMLGPALSFSYIFLNIQKKQYQILIALGFILLGTGSFLQARTWQNQIFLYMSNLRVNPDSLVCHTNLGNVFTRRKLFDKAFDQYQAILKKIPHIASSHFNMGVVYYGLQEFEKALASYRKSAEINPSHWETHNNMAVIFLEMGRFEEAKASFEKGLEIRPLSAATKRGLGVALFEMNKPNQAIILFRESLQVKPEHPVPYYQLGLFWQEKGETEKALELFKTSLGKDPFFILAKDAIKNIRSNAK